MTDQGLAVDVPMLVRRPPAEVYEAFADPDRIRRFWLASSSGRLETGATVHWTFKVAGAETDVTVLDARPGERLELRWDDGQPLTITFAEHADGTVVGVHLTGFPDAATAVDASSGFTLVLASVKAWLEHEVAGDLMYDRFPDTPYADRP